MKVINKIIMASSALALRAAKQNVNATCVMSLHQPVPPKTAVKLKK